MTDFIAFVQYQVPHGTGGGTLPALASRSVHTNALPAIQGKARSPAIGYGAMAPLSGKAGTRAFAYGGGTLPAMGGFASEGMPTNEVSYGFGILPGLTAAATARCENHASTGINALTAIGGRAFGHFEGGFTAGNRLPALRGFAYHFDPPASWAGMVMSPGFLRSLGGEPYFIYTDAAKATDTLTLLSGMSIKDAATVSDAVGPTAHRLATLRDGIAASDVIVGVLYLDLAETLAAQDTPDLSLYLLLALSDAAQATDSTLSQRQAVATILSTMHSVDGLSVTEIMALVDSATAEDGLAAHIAHMIELVEALDASDALVPLRMGMMVRMDDALDANDAVAALRAGLMGIADTCFIGGRLTFAGLDYTVYAMTTRGAAVTEYTGWKFNSFFELDGKTYGVAEDGIHLLEGEDDAGAAITGSVRMGLSTLGTTLHKSVPSVYIGYNSAGKMLLKAITPASGGVVEDWYAVEAVPKSVDANGRFTLGKGLKSAYWDFEISNVDGADFELDFVQAWRLVLNRRI